MKNCPPEFKADAVALYQSRPGATIRQIAGDLGINPETLRNWIRAPARVGPGAGVRRRRRRSPRSRPSSLPHASGSVSWRRSARF
ncbi:transposase [Streptomyces sp. NPDC056480]|uniref:transposase n=1 Tax=Streptomyces sp. NPDC056480 TaxID=3345833 RepID=UPI00367E74E7